MTADFDPRHNARIIVLQKLFEKEFKTSVPEAANEEAFSEQSLQEANDLGEYDRDLSMRLYEGVLEHNKRIDSIILKLAPEWPLENISKIDLMILRMAIAEGFILELTPQKVVIDEAIELAKEFSNDQTRKFVSGVLGNLFINQKEVLL